MASIHPKTGEIQVKIVYYGPGGSGKTTNMEYIDRHFARHITNKMISIKTKGERTLFFDYLPFKIGNIRGYDIKLQVYSTPGQRQYNSIRKIVLKGVDGIVFVADSLPERRRHNIDAFNNLVENMDAYGRRIRDVPIVFQYNKRDLIHLPLLTKDTLNNDLNKKLKTYNILASALNGINVGETLKLVTRESLYKLKRNLGEGKFNPDHKSGMRYAS